MLYPTLHCLHDRKNLALLCQAVAVAYSVTAMEVEYQILTPFASLVAAQIQDMEMVRQKIYNLEQNQITIKARYGRLITHFCLSST